MLHTDIQTDIHFTIIYIYHHHHQHQHHHHCHHHIWECTQALQYVKNYAGGSSMWQGFPIKVLIIHIVIIALSTWLLSTLLSSTSLSSVNIIFVVMEPGWRANGPNPARLQRRLELVHDQETRWKVGQAGSTWGHGLVLQVWMNMIMRWWWIIYYGHDNCDHNSDFLL